MGGRVGGSRPGRKILSLVVSMLLGGSHIDHADRLRKVRVLSKRRHWSDPSRTRPWAKLRRFWSAGGGPKDGPVTVDVDGLPVLSKKLAGGRR